MERSKKRIVEEYLVSNARMGDQLAKEKLVTLYHKKFLRHAYRLLNDMDPAKEAVQDGWLDILRGLPKLNEDAAFAAWSFRIITRKCAKQISRLQAARGANQFLTDDVQQDSQAEVELELAADRRSLRAAMAELPNTHRAAVALFYLEEMTVAEVAVALEIPVGTVKTRLMNARRKLRAALEGEENGCSRQTDQ